MKHSINKIRFKKGADATRSSLRKLIGDFVRYGKISTTVKRAKAVQSTMDRLIFRSLENSEASKNVLAQAFGDSRLVDRLVAYSTENVKKRVGGYVRLVKLGARQGDGAEIARVEWVDTVVLPVESPKVIEAKMETEKDAEKMKQPQAKTKSSSAKVKKQTGAAKKVKV